MRARVFLLALSGVVLAGGIESASAVPIVSNYGFQRPNLGTGSSAYGYANATGGGGPLTNFGTNHGQGTGGWTFSAGGSGIAGNGSAFNTAGADTVNDTDGSVNNASNGQAALLQNTGCSISQSIAFDCNTYQLTFIAEGRNSTGGPNPFTVQIGSTFLTFTPASQVAIGSYAAGPSATIGTPSGGTTNSQITPPKGTSFYAYTSDPFTIASGPATLTFTGLGITGSDVTSFVDDVAFTPEPASCALLALGGAGLLLRRRKA